MANHGRSSLLWIILATAVLLLVAACNGFFIDPTLTAISVTPTTASIAPCSPPPPAGSVCTVQLTATGTFNDGSTGPTSVTWTSGSTAVATVNTGGLVTGVAPGSATISAASGSITAGTASITVCGVNTATISITGPTTASLTTTPLPSYTAKGSSGQDITAQVVWQSLSPAVATISATTGQITALSSAGSTNIIATACGVTSNTITLTVSAT